MAQSLFVFLQMEFPWLLGPADGRYLARSERGGEAEHVVVFETLATGPADGARRAPRRGAMRVAGLLERPREATAAPAEVSTTRVTVVDPVSLSAEHQARAWLEDLDASRYVQGGADVVNRVIQLHRIASADPYVREVSPAQAIVIRAGWGEGEQVADGRWLHARELRPPDSGRPGGSKARTAALRPQERLAAMLGARNDSLLCEELVLRARLDLDHGRLELAALELQGALRTAVEELAREQRQDLALRLAELEQLQAGVHEQAGRALDRGETLPDEEVVRHALERLEAALRARTAPGFAGL
jgi:hypothetical protein